MVSTPFEEAAIEVIEKRQELNHLFDYHIEEFVDQEIKRAEAFLGCSFSGETRQILGARVYNYFLSVVSALARKKEGGS